jgi:PIN domain nuclease of toxin-antitoxin system
VLAGSLAGQHRDPFDRMIAAQAMCEHLEVVTADDALGTLGARCVW